MTTKFEYKPIICPRDALISVLNSHGQHGWRMVAIERISAAGRDVYEVIFEKEHAAGQETTAQTGAPIQAMPEPAPWGDSDTGEPGLVAWSEGN